MVKDPDFDDTLMHVSGNILKDGIGEQVKPYKKVRYVTPGKLSAGQQLPQSARREP
jgi:hypothetical protein